MSETIVFCTLALLGGGLFLLVTVTSLNWYYPTVFYGIVAFVAFQRYFGVVEDGSQPPGPRQAMREDQLPSPESFEQHALEFSPPLKVQVRGKDAQATAVLISGESGKETQRYLVGLPGSPLTWVNSEAVSIPPAAPTAQPPSTTEPQEHLIELSPPLKVKVGAKDGEAIAVQIKTEGDKETQRYLVGLPGSPLTWVNSEAVSIPPAAPDAPAH